MARKKKYKLRQEDRIDKRFRTWLESKGKAPDTIKNYTEAIRMVPLELLLNAPEELNDYIYLEMELPPSKIDMVTAAIRTFYKFYRKPEWITYIEKTDRKKRLPETKFLTKTQVKRIRENANFVEKLIFDTVYVTGVRRGILASMKVADIDFENQKLKVGANYVGNKAKIYYENTLKYLKLIDRYKALLKARLKGEVTVTTGSRGVRVVLPRKQRILPTDLIYDFVYYKYDEVKEKDPRDIITYIFLNMGKRVGVHSPPHYIRHTAGTELYKATRDIILVRNFLGQVTTAAAERYIHIVEREEAEKSIEKRFKV